MLSTTDRLVLLQHGGLEGLHGKTGLAMLRYRQGPIVAVVDPDHAGADLATVTGIPRSVPIVADLQAALAFDPTVAVIGLAPSGGQFPATMQRDVELALEAGLSLANGLHARLAEDPQLQKRLQPDRWIWDLRREPEGVKVAAARAATAAVRRVLFVGTDMCVGKMSSALELLRAGEHRGWSVAFVGTGQAGILITGGGIALDAVRVDYAAGAVEAAVLQTCQGHDWVLIEGQGSVLHPASTATLPLLRGSQPTDLVLVHRAGQQEIRPWADDAPAIAIPPLPQVIALYEAMAAVACPGTSGLPRPQQRIRAVALNTAHLEEREAKDAIRATQEQTGLCCDDPVRFGGAAILDALCGAGT